MRRRRSAAIVGPVVLAAAAACATRPLPGADGDASAGMPEAAVEAGGIERPAEARTPVSPNRVPYIPAQCFAETQADGEAGAHDPCYVCHTRGEPPNYVDDEDLVRRLSLPPAARDNPWQNLLSPPRPLSPAWSDEALLAYVRRSNYFDADGAITLARTLDAVPPAWDTNHNGRWDGFRPDAWFSFDDRGFDHRADGSFTGWRAFAYYPLPGAFLPTNGSFDDVLIRLPPAFQEDVDGRFDRTIYAVNLAVVEALIRRVDVPIDPVDESALGADVDLDGRLGKASHVAFDRPKDANLGTSRMHYVGRARSEEAAAPTPPLAGVYPLGTEFLHTVRYLDVGKDGTVRISDRMKEVRYARKARAYSYPLARAKAMHEARDQDESVDGTHIVRWTEELGIFTPLGWVLSAFIEDRDGGLRPQSRAEMSACEGCHGGIGATTDGTFSFARKLAGGPARGWFHPTQHDLSGSPEPKRADGRYEYTLYLTEVGGGDDFRSNEEVRARFFDGGLLRNDAVERLHRDVSLLLVPSPQRALALDRAYVSLVLAQSFELGRDVVLGPGGHIHRASPLGRPTGIVREPPRSPLAP
jgi:hypothetical protein